MTRAEYLLTVLNEECAEVIHISSKALRFGLDDVEPGTSDNNLLRLEKELADLVAVAEMFGLRIRDEDKAAKREKLEKWMKYSKQVGRLESAEA